MDIWISGDCLLGLVGDVEDKNFGMLGNNCICKSVATRAEDAAATCGRGSMGVRYFQTRVEGYVDDSLIIASL